MQNDSVESRSGLVELSNGFKCSPAQNPPSVEIYKSACNLFFCNTLHAEDKQIKNILCLYFLIIGIVFFKLGPDAVMTIFLLFWFIFLSENKFAYLMKLHKFNNHFFSKNWRVIKIVLAFSVIILSFWKDSNHLQ